MIASFGMALRYSFQMVEAADLLDRAIADTLAAGLRTPDIWSQGTSKVGTTEMTEAVLAALETSDR